MFGDSDVFETERNLVKLKNLAKVRSKMTL